ncbi:uncharacterized protein LOC125027571 [Penaeus chinensis]|uniref:uncharacterized protein LOC125027571 n=1 Tax=Penaeus chinensis TaxID=139456 RepID=UPI001FB5D1E2|nr:uncharacterized protein LOC125027571 [Penaeus chinensis]
MPRYSLFCEVLSCVKSKDVVPKIYTVPNLNECSSEFLKNTGRVGEVCIFLTERAAVQPSKKRRLSSSRKHTTIDICSPGHRLMSVSVCHLNKIINICSSFMVL